MPAKSKATQAGTTATPSAPKTKMKIVGPAVPAPAMLSEHELDQKLEQIRIRGAQISADLDALSRKLGLS